MDKPLLKALKEAKKKWVNAVECYKATSQGKDPQSKALWKREVDTYRYIFTKIREAVKEMRTNIETDMGMGEYNESGPMKTPRYRQEFWKGKREAQAENLKQLPTNEELDALTKGDSHEGD